MIIEIPKGYSIYTAAQYAKKKCLETRNNHVSYVFNGIELMISANSCEEDICTIYQLECKIRRLENKQ